MGLTSLFIDGFPLWEVKHELPKAFPVFGIGMGFTKKLSRYSGWDADLLNVQNFTNPQIQAKKNLRPKKSIILTKFKLLQIAVIKKKYIQINNFNEIP